MNDREIEQKAIDILVRMKPEIAKFPLAQYNSFLLSIKWPEDKAKLNRLCVHGIQDWLNRAMDSLLADQLAATKEFKDFLYAKQTEGSILWFLHWLWRKKNHVPESLSCWFKYCVFNRSPNGNDLKTR